MACFEVRDSLMLSCVITAAVSRWSLLIQTKCQKCQMLHKQFRNGIELLIFYYQCHSDARTSVRYCKLLLFALTAVRHVGRQWDDPVNYLTHL